MRCFAIIFGALGLVSAAATADVGERWFAGIGAGHFDADRDRTYLNSGSYAVFAGYTINRYFTMEVTVDYVDTTRELNEEDTVSEFGAWGVSPAFTARWPLDEGFDIYARLGATYLDYTMEDLALPRVQGTAVQPMFGVGVGTRHLFVEYTNYGERNDMLLEQLRVGLRFRF